MPLCSQYQGHTISPTSFLKPGIPGLLQMLSSLVYLVYLCLRSELYTINISAHIAWLP